MTTPPATDPTTGFATHQLHAGVRATAVNPRALPIYLTAGFVHDDFDEAVDHFATGDGFSYTRVANPTAQAVESRVATLEHGDYALLVGSGQAALAVTLMGLVQAGDHVLSASAIYEGSRGFFTENLARLGVEVEFVDDANDPHAWERLIRPTTRGFFAESIPNPRNQILDIEAVASVSKKNGIPFIIDNTLATPYLVRPLDHGADIVIHSASKFFAGHGAVLGGLIVDNRAFDIDYGAIAMRWGPTPSPLNAFLINQGIETLSLRVERQSYNALGVARWLEQQPGVQSVDYSGLEANPFHALAQRYLPNGQGSVFSFTLEGGLDAARRFVNALEVFTHMTHLGDVRSLILHPGTTSHTLRSDDDLTRAGILPGTLRVSIGIEDLADLIRDLDRGLEAVRS